MSFSQLPPELICHLLSCIPPADLLTFVLLNKTCYAVSQDRLWGHRRFHLLYQDISLGRGFSDERSNSESPIFDLMSEPYLRHYVLDLDTINYSTWGYDIEDLNDNDRTELRSMITSMCCDFIMEHGLWPDTITLPSSLSSSGEGELNDSIAPVDTFRRKLMQICRQAPPVMACMLPLFPYLKRLNMTFLNSFNEENVRENLLVGQIISAHVTNVRLMARYPDAYTSLTEVVLNPEPRNNAFVCADILPLLLRLPSLQVLMAANVMSGLDTSIRMSITSSAKSHPKAPLRKLILMRSSISTEDLAQILSFIRANTLEEFQIECSALPRPGLRLDFRLTTATRHLFKCAQHSLQRLVMNATDCFLRRRIGGWSDVLEHLPDEGLDNDGFAFNHSCNLAGFVRLDDVTLDAEFLLNGYGILSHGFGGDLWPAFDEITPVRNDARTWWPESCPFRGPGIAELLPMQLKVLQLHFNMKKTAFLREKFVDVLRSGKEEISKTFPQLEQVTFSPWNDASVQASNVMWRRYGAE